MYVILNPRLIAPELTIADHQTKAVPSSLLCFPLEDFWVQVGSLFRPSSADLPSGIQQNFDDIPRFRADSIKNPTNVFHISRNWFS